LKHFYFFQRKLIDEKAGNNSHLQLTKMKQINKTSDLRLEGYCVYCGGIPETKDHVPSKILMDKPFPKNLPVVPACNDCNQDFSKGEEYFACLIECILRGTAEPDKLKRKKIQDILERKPKLRARIEKAKVEVNGQTFFKTEADRVRNVILKLARGHATFENSEFQLEEPVAISIRPITEMDKDEQVEYFSQDDGLLPEIGSRAFNRMFLDEDFINNWLIVQEEKYMYSINHGRFGLSIKFLIWNYLACEVIWN